MHFSKEKIEKLKNLPAKRIGGKVVSLLGDEIRQAVEEGGELKTIIEELEREIGKKLSYDYIRQALRKKNIDNQKEKQKGECEMKKNVILVANDKGGVGKTTISSFLNLPRQVIINLDKSRVISEVFPYKEIIDFEIYKNANGFSDIQEYLDHLLLSPEDKHENIVLDTKGGAIEHVLDEVMSVREYVTHIIVPTKVGDLSETPSYQFIANLKALFDQIGKRVKWALVFNEISSKYLKRNGIRYELGDMLQNTVNQIKEHILGEDLKVATYFRRSEAVVTREITKQDIDEMYKQYPAAYLPIINELNRFNRDIEEMLKE